MLSGLRVISWATANRFIYLPDTRPEHIELSILRCRPRNCKDDLSDSATGSESRRDQETRFRRAHISEDPFQFALVHHRKQTASVIANEAVIRRSDMFDHFRMALVEQIHELRQPWQLGGSASF